MSKSNGLIFVAFSENTNFTVKTKFCGLLTVYELYCYNYLLISNFWATNSEKTQRPTLRVTYFSSIGLQQKGETRKLKHCFKNWCTNRTQALLLNFSNAHKHFYSTYFASSPKKYSIIQDSCSGCWYMVAHLVLYPYSQYSGQFS